jgi:hypothetical protein
MQWEKLSVHFYAYDYDLIHLAGYSSGTGGWWLLAFGRFSECLIVIANAERREYLESHMIRAV